MKQSAIPHCDLALLEVQVDTRRTVIALAPQELPGRSPTHCTPFQTGNAGRQSHLLSLMLHAPLVGHWYVLMQPVVPNASVPKK